MFPVYFCKPSQGQLPKNGACGISHVALSIDNGCQFGNWGSRCTMDQERPLDHSLAGHTLPTDHDEVNNYCLLL